jgi:predicted polyphosphate/ATP-dependent NAD kinase
MEDLLQKVNKKARKKVGLIINPIAGIGGRVGLKGSDGREIQQRALALGAVPLSGERAAQALLPLQALAAEFELLVAPGKMGEELAHRCGFDPRVIPASSLPDRSTTAEDTRMAARSMVETGVDLILFAGGDGTARDIYAAVGSGIPVLGIPAGVKIHSAVFGITPHCAGELAAAFLQGKRLRLQEAEVLDLDEDLYRQGHIFTRLYGTLKIPYRPAKVQNQKVPTPASQAAQAQAIAADVIERIEPGMAYLLGPGTTTRALAERLGLVKTLVGVDILTRSEMIAADVNERQILELLDHRPLGLILTPIGGQGFLLGRGNQQISPQVIRRVGRAAILVICLASKIAALQGRPMLVDTGDAEVDRLLAGYIQVVTGYHESIIYKIISP